MVYNVHVVHPLSIVDNDDEFLPVATGQGNIRIIGFYSPLNEFLREKWFEMGFWYSTHFDGVLVYQSNIL